MTEQLTAVGAARSDAGLQGAGSCQLRAVDPLVIEACGDKIILSSPRLARRLSVGPAIAGIVLQGRDGIDPAGLPAAVLERLCEAGFLVDARQQPDPLESPWREWGTTAWSFYRRMRDTHFVSKGTPDAMREYVDRIATAPRPSSLRACASDRILLLPRVRCELDVPFRTVLEGRRTHRHFKDEPLALDRFSDLLHYTFAPLRFADAGELGTLQLRAAASGGARHETEAFVFVFNVTSVQPGLYHYDNIRHGLEPINENVSRADLEDITHRQGFFQNAAFGILTVAMVERMSWKYPHPIAYRMMLQNVGHVAQVFSMTAMALGLGASLTGAVKESVAEPLLGISPPGELITFALACGKPVVRPEDGLPYAIKLPRVAPDYY